MPYGTSRTAEHTQTFFEQELDRLLTNVTLLYKIVNNIGLEREKLNKNNT